MHDSSVVGSVGLVEFRLISRTLCQRGRVESG